MRELLERIDRLIAQHGLPWERTDDVIDVQVEPSRRQQVRICESEGTIRIYSTVLPAAYVKEDYERWGQLARRVWRKNAHADLVGFGFDRQDRLIGFAEYPGTEPPDVNLIAYVEAVAWGSDRLEYQLVGIDES